MVDVIGEIKNSIEKGFSFSMLRIITLRTLDQT